MPADPVKNLLPRFETRMEYFDFLDRWTVGTVAQLEEHMSPRALVKAFALETSRAAEAKGVPEAARGSHVVSRVDESLYRLRQRDEAEDWALLESEDARYPVLYTALESKEAERRVNHLVRGSPLLDRTWFAAPLFDRLWSVVLDAYPSHRFSQLVFEHEGLFEDFLDEQESLGDSEEGWVAGPEEESGGVSIERRRARIQITERIGTLSTALTSMREDYGPLRSIVRLRVPAAERGGHDVFFDGQFTNRSDSIVSLRQTVGAVIGIYRHTTEAAEAAAWPSDRDTQSEAGAISLGAPLLIQFSERLELGTFDRWIASLQRKNNRFRLWGVPIHLGLGKAHLYAVDNHLWQPIDLEITRDHVYALLPSGTCGNTIHRLVTNIQRFVDPGIDVFIGDRRYEEFIESASTQVGGGGPVGSDRA